MYLQREILEVEFGHQNPTQKIDIFTLSKPIWEVMEVGVFGSIFTQAMTHVPPFSPHRAVDAEAAFRAAHEAGVILEKR